MTYLRGQIFEIYSHDPIKLTSFLSAALQICKYLRKVLTSPAALSRYCAQIEIQFKYCYYYHHKKINARPCTYISSLQYCGERNQL